VFESTFGNVGSGQMVSVRELCTAMRFMSANL
jgi:hypothetical protein